MNEQEAKDTLKGCGIVLSYAIVVITVFGVLAMLCLTLIGRV